MALEGLVTRNCDEACRSKLFVISYRPESNENYIQASREQANLLIGLVVPLVKESFAPAVRHSAPTLYAYTDFPGSVLRLRHNLTKMP
jgi:hypothetical protein